MINYINQALTRSKKTKTYSEERKIGNIERCQNRKIIFFKKKSMVTK